MLTGGGGVPKRESEPYNEHHHGRQVHEPMDIGAEANFFTRLQHLSHVAHPSGPFERAREDQAGSGVYGATICSDTRRALQTSSCGAFAEFERNLMLERQREGIAKAKSEGEVICRESAPPHYQRRIRFGRWRRRASQRVTSPNGSGSANGVCSGCWRCPAISGLRSAVDITEGE